MGIISFIHTGSTVLILATIFSTSVAGEHHRQGKNRMCIPAEAAPTLSSSSCYPLVNFSRPFCQNHGITLPSYVYGTPEHQINRNSEINKDYDFYVMLGGASKVSHLLHEDINRVKKCIDIALIGYCRYSFPRCDATQSVFKRQKICRESCLKFTHICGKLWKLVITANKIRPMGIEMNSCELQPYRNAGDSPECWYMNTISTDISPDPEWSISAGCLYLNGSSYRGTISVTASGIPCQSWTEQCPHRHTMTETYPELNNAENYCRNPQNSGKRPWCFTTDRKKRWEYCDIPECLPVNGSYGNWSSNTTCNVTCGEGFEIWTRQCNNPEPKDGGRNCSHLGESVQYRPCSAKPCPVNGGYSNWTLSVPCIVSCGDGVEIWRRTCDNPEPKYSGRNCSRLGISTEYRNCSKTPCPIDGNYSNWTKLSSCSVTCGKGVEIWTRKCDNPPGKYGGNCSKHGADYKILKCEMESCPVHFNSQMIAITVVAAVFVIVMAVTCFIFYLRKSGSLYYARLDFSLEQCRSDTSGEVTSSSQQTGTDAEYQNLTREGNPTPGLSRGVVCHRRDYMNTRPARNSWYDRLQLIRPIAIAWLRNAWGNVDEFGRHIYDVMQRVRHVFVPYDKLGNLREGDSAKSGVERSDKTYDTMGKPTGVILPTRSENVSTTEIENDLSIRLY